MNEASSGVSTVSVAQQWAARPAKYDEVPTEQSVVAQVALFWRDTLLDVQDAWPGQVVQGPEGLTEPLLRWAGNHAIVAGKPLGEGEHAVVPLGEVCVAVRYRRPDTRVLSDGPGPVEVRFFKYSVVAVLVFAALATSFVITPRAEAGEALFHDPARMTKLLVQPMPEKVVVSKRLEKASQDEGKAGQKQAKQQQAAPSKQRGDPRQNKQRVEATFASLFGSSSSSTVFNPGGLGGGINNALNGLTNGAPVGDANGLGGLGSRGNGNGGGNTNLHLGGLGINPGPKCASCGVGLSSRGHEGVTPGGPPHIVGGLDKDTIFKVVKRHQSEIKFCYERALASDQKLAGKVTVAWTIDPTGAVSEANLAESTLDNANVEACVLERIRRWRFPEPVGGGVVAVSFPWVFSAAGSGE
jgi:TonB family protein